jgi:phosphopantothenoylcysteine synthetase/decarboxylase
MRTLTQHELHTLKTGMTVRDLIDELSTHDPEAIVVFACDYGDICHTQQALPVSSAAELDTDEERVVGSAYSHSGLAVEELESDDADDEDDDEDEPEADKYDGPAVVVLR